MREAASIHVYPAEVTYRHARSRFFRGKRSTEWPVMGVVANKFNRPWGYSCQRFSLETEENVAFSGHGQRVLDRLTGIALRCPLCINFRSTPLTLVPYIVRWGNARYVIDRLRTVPP